MNIRPQLAHIPLILLAALASATAQTGADARPASQKSGTSSGTGSTAKPAKPDQKLLGRLEKTLDLCRDEQWHADRRADDYHSLAAEFEQLNRSVGPGKPSDAVPAFARGLARLRESLVVQQAALEKEAANASGARRLLVQDEAEQMGAAATQVAADMIEVGRVRDLLAKAPKSPDFSTQAAAMRRLEMAARNDSVRLTLARQKLESEIAALRTPEPAPAPVTAPSKPGADVAVKPLHASSGSSHATSLACPFHGTWVFSGKSRDSNFVIELRLGGEPGRSPGQYSIKQPGYQRLLNFTTQSCVGEEEELHVGSFILKVTPKAAKELRLSSATPEEFGLPKSDDNLFRPTVTSSH